MFLLLNLSSFVAALTWSLASAKDLATLPAPGSKLSTPAAEEVDELAEGVLELAEADADPEGAAWLEEELAEADAVLEVAVEQPLGARAPPVDKPEGCEPGLPPLEPATGGKKSVSDLAQPNRMAAKTMMNNFVW